jgi:hypothetical protein
MANSYYGKYQPKPKSPAVGKPGYASSSGSSSNNQPQPQLGINPATGRVEVGGTAPIPEQKRSDSPYSKEIDRLSAPQQETATVPLMAAPSEPLISMQAVKSTMPERPAEQAAKLSVLGAGRESTGFGRLV